MPQKMQLAYALEAEAKLGKARLCHWSARARVNLVVDVTAA